MRFLPRLPLIVVVFCIAAVVALVGLTRLGDGSRIAQLRTERAELALTDLQSAPFNADPHAGGDPRRAAEEIATDEDVFHRLRTDTATRRQMRSVQTVVRGIYAQATAPAGLYGSHQTPILQEELTTRSDRLLASLHAQADRQARSASVRLIAAEVGTVATVLALLGLFTLVYLRLRRSRRRAERLADENAALLRESRIEAVTDSLTGVGNRRALFARLEQETRAPSAPEELMLAIFDLNGFKSFNDRFGHSAGDALLARRAHALRDALAGRGEAFRLGGDEFCILARPGDDEQALLRNAFAALGESGADWTIAAAGGAVHIPSEAAEVEVAMILADQRMYADKAASRSTATGREPLGPPPPKRPSHLAAAR